MMDYLIHAEHSNTLAEVHGMLLLTLNLFVFKISNLNSTLKAKDTARGENAV